MALAVEILLAASVLLAFGLSAAGRLDGMSNPVPDAPPGLPPGPVTPRGLRTVLFPVVVRGYRMADVDEVLERAAQELERARQDAAPDGDAEFFGHEPEYAPEPEPATATFEPAPADHDVIDG